MNSANQIILPKIRLRQQTKRLKNYKYPLTKPYVVDWTNALIPGRNNAYLRHLQSSFFITQTEDLAIHDGRGIEEHFAAAEGWRLFTIKDSRGQLLLRTEVPSADSDRRFFELLRSWLDFKDPPKPKLRLL